MSLPTFFWWSLQYGEIFAAYDELLYKMVHKCSECSRWYSAGVDVNISGKKGVVVYCECHNASRIKRSICFYYWFEMLDENLEKYSKAKNRSRLRDINQYRLVPPPQRNQCGRNINLTMTVCLMVLPIAFGNLHANKQITFLSIRRILGTTQHCRHREFRFEARKPFWFIKVAL